MKKLFYIALLTLPLVGSAQSYNEPFRKRGEVFKVYAGSENKKEDDSGLIVVTRETNRFVYEDDAIPDAYKKMTEKFMRSILIDDKYKKFCEIPFKCKKRLLGQYLHRKSKSG